MDDEPNARSVVVDGLLQEWPRVPAVRADRVQEGFDDDGARVDAVLRVHEPVVPRRRQGLGAPGGGAVDGEEGEGPEQRRNQRARRRHGRRRLTRTGSDGSKWIARKQRQLLRRLC